MNAQLTKAGAYKVERLHGIPNPGQPVNLERQLREIRHQLRVFRPRTCK